MFSKFPPQKKIWCWLHGIFGCNHFLVEEGCSVIRQGCILYLTFKFTFMYLADAFIQSDLQCIQAIHFSVCVFPYKVSKGIPFLGMSTELYLQEVALDIPSHVQCYQVLSMAVVLNWLISMA